MSECIDPEMSTYLHAYELNTITEEDLEAFELHLMRCDYCFHEVEQMKEAMRAIRGNSEVIRLAEESLDHSESSPLTRLWNWLWPDTALLSKPALLVLALLVLIYPAYLGLRSNPTPAVSELSSVRLFPTRSGSGVVPADRDVVLSFVVEQAVPGREYRLEIGTASGATVYSDDSFADFDDYQTGHLLISAGALQPGLYTLTIRDSVADNQVPLEAYKLIVAP